MKRTCLVAPCLAACLALIPAGDAHATGDIADDWVAYYNTACQTLVDATTFANGCVLCHGSGFSLNGYGDDVAGSPGNFAAIESEDGDNDGRTNGEEILIDCTLPGDNGSVPEEEPTWSAIKVLFR